MASVTVTATVKGDPVAVEGVPEIRPVAVPMERPAGKPLAAHVNWVALLVPLKGLTPPVLGTSKMYAVPTKAGAIALTVMTGAAPIVIE